ncbi:MAG: hypothetical protein MUF06_24590, partial [Pirellulaceae bacterium]|nr:hypothetical protein [Pirellulaceae bacterium]
MLIGFPGVMLGIAPLLASAWWTKISDRLLAISGFGSLAALGVILVLSWYGIRPVFRFIERSFWALHALAVQPVYAFVREALSQVAEAFLDEHAAEQERSRRRAPMAILAGILSSSLAGAIVFIIWPATQWSATWETFAAPSQLILPALANAVTIVGIYLMASSLAWGMSDAMMDQPVKVHQFAAPDATSRQWRIAHLSDLHIVGERFGYRIESGRSGPRGNDRLDEIFRRLDALHCDMPLD